jgi:hypothetical protein
MISNYEQKKSFKKKVDKKNEFTRVNLINQPLVIWDRDTNNFKRRT